MRFTRKQLVDIINEEIQEFGHGGERTYEEPHQEKANYGQVYVDFPDCPETAYGAREMASGEGGDAIACPGAVEDHIPDESGSVGRIKRDKERQEKFSGYGNGRSGWGVSAVNNGGMSWGNGVGLEESLVSGTLENNLMQALGEERFKDFLFQMAEKHDIVSRKHRGSTLEDLNEVELSSLISALKE